MNWYWINAGLWIAWLVYWFVAARFTARTKAAESWLQRAQHVVPLTVGMFLIFHDPREPLLLGRMYHSHWMAIAGTAITAAGLLFTVWARIFLGRFWSGTVTVKEGHELIRSGPYRFVRHPIYTGFTTGTLGSAITMGTVDAFVGAAIIIVTCVLKIRREERLLTAEFGDAYRQFRAEVPMIIPFVL